MENQTTKTHYHSEESNSICKSEELLTEIFWNSRVDENTNQKLLHRKNK